MPAKTLDQIVQEQLGAQQLALCQAQASTESLQERVTVLQAENAELRAKLAALESAPPKES